MSEISAIPVVTLDTCLLTPAIAPLSDATTSRLPTAALVQSDIAATFAVVPTRSIAAEAASAVDMPCSALARISAAFPVAACAVALICPIDATNSSLAVASDWVRWSTSREVPRQVGG